MYCLKTGRKKSSKFVELPFQRSPYRRGSIRKVFHSFHGLEWTQKNWPASNVWVFIAQLVKHFSANAEAMGSNPVEAPLNLYSKSSHHLYPRYGSIEFTIFGTQKTARKKKRFFFGKGGSTVLSTKAKDSLRQGHWCKLVLRQRSRFAKPFKQQRLWNSHAGKLFSGIFMVDYYLDVWFLTMSRRYRNIDFYQLHYKQSS